MTEDVQLPWDRDAEEYIVGCLVAFPERANEVYGRLAPQDFHHADHRKIIAEGQRQFAAGGVDPPLLGKVTGHPTILCKLGIDPSNAPTTTAHIPSEAAKIVTARQTRQRYEELQSLASRALNGHTPEQIDLQLEAALYEWRRERQISQPQERFTFADLHKQHATLHDPLIDGLLRLGEIGNVISYSKIGKSWMTYGLDLSVIVGGRWLGRFDCAKRKALHIDNELHKCTLAHRIPKVAEAMGILTSDYDQDLEVVSLRGNLRSLADLAVDLETIEPGEFGLITLDAKYRFALAGVSENDNSAETALYNTLDHIAEQTKAAIVLVHHSSKGDQSGKRVTDTGSGAGAQSRAADCHLVLREHEEPNTVVLEAAVRSFAPVEPLAIKWEFPLWLPAFDVDPVKLKGRNTKSEDRQNDKDREGCEATLTALIDGPASARALRRITGFGEYRQERLLDLLSSQGSIEFEVKKKGSVSFHEYRLKP